MITYISSWSKRLVSIEKVWSIVDKEACKGFYTWDQTSKLRSCCQ